MIKKLVRRVVAPLLVLTAILLGVPGQAQAYTVAADAFVTVRSDLTQSNMLFSFENTYTGTIYQNYVNPGILNCRGEGNNNVVPSGCNDNTSEPRNMWVNPHWCSGHRTLIYDLNTGQHTTSVWAYYQGGATGKSINVAAGFGAPANQVWKIEAYLVPNGVAGCVS